MIGRVPHSTIDWLAQAESAIALYRLELLRLVASKLIRPRTQYTPEELRQRMLTALDDPVAIDRALKSASPIARQLLRMIDLSRQPRWTVASLADLLPILGHNEGLAPVQQLIESGLLFPELSAGLPIESVEAWLQQAAFDPICVVAVPLVAERCRAEPLFLKLTESDKPKLSPTESDGLEWVLRASVVWQSMREAPLRRTQNGGLFKRDQERLRGISLLASPMPDAPAAIEDPALLAGELARGVGLIREEVEEWVVGPFPSTWSRGSTAACEELWSVLNGIRTWDPLRGYDPDLLTRKWMPTLGVALVAALAESAPTMWWDPAELALWLANRQPDAEREIKDLAGWCTAYLLGVLYSIRAIEAANTGNGWRVRLTTSTRSMLDGNRPANSPASIQHTLLVQPNLEVIVYRQGLTPELIVQLSQFAEWKTIGLACTMVLTPESVYRGLESGLTMTDILRILERHSSRPLADSVIESLRSWASKRERVQVYQSAILLEFRTVGDLEHALKSGLIEQKLTDRIGVVADESALDYSRFRLVGSRDYLAPEECCVEVEGDGLTLQVSDGKADLLLAAELRRFCDPLEASVSERSRHRISVASLQRAKETGIDLKWLEDWFQRRSGFNVPPTARLLFQGRAAGLIAVQPMAVLRVPSSEVGDGLANWPAAREFILDRLGPTAFAVDQERLSQLQDIMSTSGLDFRVGSNEE